MLATRREAPASCSTSPGAASAAAILLSTVVGYLCVVAAYVAPETVFLFLLNSSGAIILFVYLLIGVSQLVMRPKIPPAQLRVKMWFYPYLTLFTIAAMIAVLVSMGIKSDTRSQLFLSLLAFAVVLAAYPLSRRLIGPAVVTLPTAAVTGFLHGPSLRPWQAPAPRRWWPRVLVIANETVGADELLAELRQLRNENDAGISSACPRTRCTLARGRVWSPDASIIAAQHRLDAVLAILRSEGLRAEGELGDYRPLHAMDDAVQKFKPDLIVISTHPEERSAWLRQDIVERAKQVRRPGPAHRLPRSGGNLRHLTASGTVR